METLGLFFVSCWENYYLYGRGGGWGEEEDKVCMLVAGITGM